MYNSCNLMNYNLPGSSVHGFLQASIPEWATISFSRETSWLRNWTQVSPALQEDALPTELPEVPW